MHRPIPYSQAQQNRNSLKAMRQQFQSYGTPRQWLADIVGGIGLIFTILALVILADALIN